MADEQNTVQPNPNTGDILGAMQAEQASMATLYQLEVEQVNILLDLNETVGALYSELQAQTSILEDLYDYITRHWGSGAQGGAGNQSASVVSQPDTTNRDVYDYLGRGGMEHNAYAQMTQQYIAHNHRREEQLNRYIEEINQRNPDQDNTAAIESMLSRIGFITNALSGSSGSNLIRGGGQVLGEAAGNAAGELTGDALTAALTPALGPAAIIVGEVGGELIGQRLGEGLSAAFDAWADLQETIENTNRKTRDVMLKDGFEKIRQDVRDMSSYSLDIYSDAVNRIYSAWDKNLNQVSATMGYTKEAINTLQDAVAQRLEEEGYGSTINASEFLDELSRVLNANLNSTLAEAFAAQSLVLEKAVPEIDLTGMAAEFGAIYTNAAQQGLDAEATMVDAMNQIAGAVKAIEQTTDGNNQFVKQVGTYLQQAQTLVNRAGGSVDNVAALATQMLAAEGPLAALAPQLSGFTGELVTLLTKQNDSSAVALRAIMHDINDNIGISATSFMQSFMEDTQGTLVTAFEAIDQFIERNENPAAREEFMDAMESIFGISGDKLDQLDFGYLAEQVAQTNASMNTQALIDAENLVKAGETTTLEQQLVDNTANMLLGTNAIRDTLDNAIMRKLEKNEIRMEQQIRQQAGTQRVDLAESTMSFFTKVKDILVDLIDPLGIFKAANTFFTEQTESQIQAMNYQIAATWSSVGSDVASDLAGNVATAVNTTAGAMAAVDAALWEGSLLDIENAVDNLSMSGSTQDLFARHQASLTSSIASLEQAAEVQSATAIGSYENQLQQEREQQTKEAREEEQKRAQEQAAAENKSMALESRDREIENHDALLMLRDEVPELRNDVQAFNGTYLLTEAETNAALINSVAIFTDAYVAGNASVLTALTLQENGFSSIVSAIAHNKPDTSKLNDIHAGVEKIITYFATYLEFLDNSLQEAGSGLRMSPSDREQITGRGLFY